MYGPAVDNDFDTNHWVYLYYAPPTVEDVRSCRRLDRDPDDAASTTRRRRQRGERADVAARLSAWDPCIGYFQLSRFKFVERPAATPAHLDLGSEQQILRVPNNRGACCHVAGDIDFDTANNLWLVTGDDTPAGGGNSGGFGPFNDQLTNESQTITVAGATGGTFTLTFDGQTTAPIPFPLDNAAIEAALEALDNVDDVTVTGYRHAARSASRRPSQSDVPLMTADATGLTGTAPTDVAMATINNGQGVNIPAEAACSTRRTSTRAGRRRTRTTCAARSLRITVKSGDIAAAERTPSAAPTRSQPATCSRPARPGRAPRSTRWASGTRSGSRSTRTTSPTSPTTRRTPRRRSSSAGPAGTGRFEIVRHPANYGWPLCYRTDLPVLPLGLQHLDAARRPPSRSTATTRHGSAERLALERRGGPTVEPGLEYGPPITNPEIWYSYRDNNATDARSARRASPTTGRRPPTPSDTCPQLFPELLHRRRRPARRRRVRLRRREPEPDEVPALLRRRVIFGEFTRDYLREVRLDSEAGLQDQQRSSAAAPVGDADAGAGRSSATTRWTCSSGEDGNFYLLTYGDGFFAANPDAGMYRWDYVKGLRAPVAVLSADADQRPGAADRRSSRARARTTPTRRLDPLRLGLRRNGTVDSIDPNPTFTYTTTGQFTAVLTVTDSSGKTGLAPARHHRRQHRADHLGQHPGRGRHLRLRRRHPVHRHGQRPRGRRRSTAAAVEVTFVLGHDTHGHAEDSDDRLHGVAADRRRRRHPRRQRLRRHLRLVHRPRRRQRPGADDDRPAPDPPEAPGGRVRRQAVRYEHRDRRPTSAAGSSAAASARATGWSSTARSTC